MLCTARTLHGQSSSGVASRSAVNSPTGWPYRWPNAEMHCSETGTHAVIRCVALPTKPNNACPESHEEIMAADNATASPGPTFHEMLDFGKRCRLPERPANCGARCCGRDSHTSLRPLRGLCGRGQVALDDLRVALASFANSAGQHVNVVPSFLQRCVAKGAHVRSSS